MNEKQIFDGLTPAESEVAARLLETAETLQPNPSFVKNTAAELRNVFEAKKETRMKRLNFLWQTLAGAGAVVALSLLIIWLVRGMAPEIQPTSVPAIQSTGQPSSTPMEATPLPTVTPDWPSYDRSGTTVYRAVDFPSAPTEVDLYAFTPSEQPATSESALALAQRLGIDGQVYAGGYYIYSYLVTDGKQRLFVNSDQDFLYFADARNLDKLQDVPLDKAQQIIATYLRTHGFDFDYRIEIWKTSSWSYLENSSGWFMVVPVTANGLPAYIGSGQLRGLSVAISPEGEILQMQANLLAAEGPSQGKFAIISAEEAWQNFLDPSFWLGSTETSGTGQVKDVQSWHRVHPENQKMTLYCSALVYPAVDPGQPPFVTCDDFVLSGDTTGMEKLEGPGVTFVALQGQFTTSNGVFTFQVEKWETTNLKKQYLTGGKVRREGDQVIFTVSEKDYLLPDVPVDFPVPVEDVSLSGVVVDHVFEWDVLGIHMPFGGGGGGGGAFAKLNLSGTPVPWPTPEPFVSPTPSTTIGQRLDGARGTLRIFIYQKDDGSQVKEYNFYVDQDDNYTSYILQGPDLAQLDNNHARPVDIWGVVTGYTAMKNPILTVERSVIPYPDLKFIFLRGRQKVSTVEGETITLLTTEDGQTYAQFSGRVPDPSPIGTEGDLLKLTVLPRPGETFGGYPVVEVFGGGMAGEPTDEQPADLPGGPDKPIVVPGDPANMSGLPALTIEKIELGYYISDPRDASATEAYLQPVWRLYGHYSDGSIFECLIQALRPEYLFPQE